MMSRTWNYRWHRGLSLAGLLVVLQTVMACMASQGPLAGTIPTETPINRLERGLMDATDLPFGWRRESTGVPRDLRGEVARYRDYRGPTGSPIFVRAGQSLVLNPMTKDSETAYEEAAATMIPAGYADKWPWPPELDFATHADQIIIGCNPGVLNDIPVRTCRVTARYGDLVTTIRAQVFEDRWLTMAQFRHLLERVDAKMEAIREPQGEATPTPAP
ncbi:hypothetical protein [Candidatus Amarolinea dominans]|uniref:hypothetical protein n=1 Tax=Candidatus Amarolinea dominans TaxID=3140696 RepID=UPI003135C0B8|nr:hypothetical protein [Anaerolineae bacterium]